MPDRESRRDEAIAKLSFSDRTDSAAAAAAAATAVLVAKAVSEALGLASTDNRIVTLEREVKKIEVIEARIAAIDKAADRYRQGFIVLVALGGLVTWIVSTWSSIKAAFK